MCMQNSHKGKDCSLDDPCAQAGGSSCSGMESARLNQQAMVEDTASEQGWDGDFCEGRSKRTCPITDDGKFVVERSEAHV